MAKSLNREAWLNRLAEMLRPWFRARGYPIHGRITVTMTTIKGNLGLCQSHDDEGMKHIFISAYEDDEMAHPVGVAGVLVHELTHAIMPYGTRHGKAFVEAAAKLGFAQTRKGSSHTTPTPELEAHLAALVAELPPLPRYGLHAPRKPKRVRDAGPKGMFKFQCDCCKTTVYLKHTSLTRAGDPRCWNGECDDLGSEMTQLNTETP